jgi:hypothetical protein
MRLDRHMLMRLLPAAVLALPIAIWAFCKPVRVLAPELTGVSCMNDYLCTDDPSRQSEASDLYEDAVQFVTASVGEIRHKPRAVFCTTDDCGRSFGLGKRSSATIGTSGIVVSPRAWQPHYVRHEMIHHLQNEQLGTLKAWLVTPEWFIEGMAYALSSDPRAVLVEPWQQYRSRFEEWYRAVGRERLWTEAAKL